MNLLKKLWELWKKFGEILGHIMSRILLSLIYIFFITPISVFYKTLNKQFFRFNNNYDTYWVERKNIEPTLENYRKQY
ncbi:MAG TPA: hypothetical protein PKY81_08920 [bacterium]|nr:hypothetical protein [bacterium]HPN31066.1 hypothetical protein [bacterium]